MKLKKLTTQNEVECMLYLLSHTRTVVRRVFKGDDKVNEELTFNTPATPKPRKW